MQPVSGPGLGPCAADSTPGSPSPSRRDAVGAALVGYGEAPGQHASTCSFTFGGLAEQRAAAGSLACPVLPQSLQTAGRPMQTQTGLLPSCWRCHGTQDKDSWELNGQRPQCLRQSLGCVRVLSPVRALTGGGGCSRGRLGQWGSGSRSQPSCHPDSEREAELREELMAEFSSRRRPLT